MSSNQSLVILFGLLLTVFSQCGSASVICSEMAATNNQNFPTLNITFTSGLNLTLPNNHTIRSFIMTTFQFSFDPNFGNATFNTLDGYLKDSPVVNPSLTGGIGNLSASPGLQEEYFSNYIKIPIAVWPTNTTLYVRYRAIPNYGMDIYDGGAKISSFTCNATRTNIYATALISMDGDVNNRKGFYIFFSDDVKNCNGAFSFPASTFSFRSANIGTGTSASPSLGSSFTLSCGTTWQILPGLASGRSDAYYCNDTSATATLCSNCYPTQVGSTTMYSLSANAPICGLTGTPVQTSIIGANGESSSNGIMTPFFLYSMNGTPQKTAGLQGSLGQTTIDVPTRTVTSVLKRYTIPMSGGTGYSILDRYSRLVRLPVSPDLYTTLKNLDRSTTNLPTAVLSNVYRGVNVQYNLASTGTSIHDQYINYISIRNISLAFISNSLATLTFDTRDSFYGFVETPTDNTFFDYHLITNMIHCVDGNSNKIAMSYYANNVTTFAFAAIIKPITCYVVYSPRMDLDYYSRLVTPEVAVVNNEPLTMGYPSINILTGTTTTYLSDNNTVTITFDNSVYGVNISAIKLNCGYENASIYNYTVLSSTQVQGYYRGCTSQPHSNPYLVIDPTTFSYWYLFTQTSVPLGDLRYTGAVGNCLAPPIDGVADYPIVGTLQGWVIITCLGQTFNKTLTSKYLVEVTSTDCHIHGYAGSGYYMNDTACYTTTHVNTKLTDSGIYAIVVLGVALLCAVLWGLKIKWSQPEHTRDEVVRLNDQRERRQVKTELMRQLDNLTSSDL